MEEHDYPTVMINIIPRTHKCIFLGTTRNIQGNHKIFCLDIGRVIKRTNIIPILSLHQVIRKVN